MWLRQGARCGSGDEFHDEDGLGVLGHVGEQGVGEWQRRIR